MPTFIKTGYWEKLVHPPGGYKGYLNLDNFVKSLSGGSVVTKTKAEIDSLVSTNSLTPGQLYEIKDASAIHYGGTSVYLTAISGNQFDKAGVGKFYNPIYTNDPGFGIWTNLINVIINFDSIYFYPGESITANNGATGYFINLNFIQPTSGDWSTATSITGDYSGATGSISNGYNLSYSSGSTVIWGGSVWTNLTGAVGNSNDIYTLDGTNWQPVPYDNINYNVVYDYIEYDYSNNYITKRADSLGNEVSSVFNGNFNYIPIKAFQWGNVNTYENIVSTSFFECINFSGNSNNNNVIQGESYIEQNVFGLGVYFSNNTFSNYVEFSNNYIYNSNVNYNNYNSSYINSNYINNSSFYGNLLLAYTEIYSNVLDSTYSSSYSGIFLNTLFNSSSIRNNYLLNQSAISYNIISNSIYSNQLYSSGIAGNFIDSSSSIYSNIIYGSNITNNLFTNGNFANSTLSNVSISYNSFINSTIYNIYTNNSIINTSFNQSYIYQNNGDAFLNNNIEGLIVNSVELYLTDYISATVLYNTYPRTLTGNINNVPVISYIDDSNTLQIVLATT